MRSQDVGDRRVAKIAVVALAILLGACGSSAPGGTSSARTAAGTTAAGQTAAATPAGGGGGAIDSCTAVTTDAMGALVGNPVKSSKAGALCAFTGPNGTVALTIQTVDASKKANAMDALGQTNTAQAVSGLGNKAIVITVSTGIDLQILKGSTFVDIAMTLNGKAVTEQLDEAKQLAAGILANI